MRSDDVTQTTDTGKHPAAGQGLTDEEAGRRLQQYGYNELPSKQRRTVIRIIGEVLREPMFLLLLAAGAIYLVLGDPGDALMLLGFVFVAMAITIFQARKTERVLESLRELSSPRALVIRSGEQKRVPGRDVVRGDLLVLEEGDRVPADGTLVECHDLLIDESLLTGESIAVSKASGTDASAEAIARIYSGSMIVQGGGLALVTATGADTELGKIGKTLRTLVQEQSPLQQEIRRLVERFAFFGAALSLLVLLLYGWSRGDWLNGLLAGITLAMSILPEEFTVILTVFMALGAWRIAKHHVLTRHTPVIEALGSATVLCVDKTGTLTQNRMAVKAVVIGRQTVATDTAQPNALSPEVRRVLESAVLASEIMPFDPMEKAFHRCLAEVCPGTSAQHHNWLLVHDYPLTKETLAMTHAWRIPGESTYTVATKGAPEAVISLCRLDQQQAADILREVQQLAAQGMRVLAVATAVHNEDLWPERPDAFRFAWLGLIGLADPLRSEVPAAVKECHQAGIRVIMITGDYPVTAQSIAKAAGLPNEKVTTGAQLQAVDDDTLQVIVRECHVFARILPEQKLRLVNALKANGDVVAMTGDGVNDAPALKAAHIGISMGERGTDVAREASSLVLLNDDFTSIVRTVRLGRRIYDNLRKALGYVVAVHVPIAGMVMFPLLFGTQMVFAPVHIVFLEMIINPACAIVFETEAAEQDIMQRPPRQIGERLFGARSIMLSLLQGLGLFIVVAAAFLFGLHAGLTTEQARAAAFTCVVLGNLALIVSNRSFVSSIFMLVRIPNPVQWWMLIGTCIALTAVLYTPGLQQMFHFSDVQTKDLLFPLFAAMVATIWFECMKLAFRRWGGKPASTYVTRRGWLHSD
ncbi:MAG TPA: cation-translocating P-type ATPase [Noviherbaspirillum sp.]|nr:cation-translocating P-type ATPase [Noviherbaspirillum sp.]